VEIQLLKEIVLFPLVSLDFNSVLILFPLFIYFTKTTFHYSQIITHFFQINPLFYHLSHFFILLCFLLPLILASSHFTFLYSLTIFLFQTMTPNSRLLLQFYPSLELSSHSSLHLFPLVSSTIYSYENSTLIINSLILNLANHYLLAQHLIFQVLPHTNSTLIHIQAPSSFLKHLTLTNFNP
jgi:hypothetical protein